MWKRDEAVRPAPAQPAAAPQPFAPAQTGTPVVRSETSHLMEKDIVNIGKSVVIKGELNGSEDLTIEGHVEGTIQLRENVLTIGPNGKIKAQVFAKAVIVLGEVTGNVTASDKVDIRDNGSVDGDIAAAASTCSARAARRTPRSPRSRSPLRRRRPSRSSNSSRLHNSPAHRSASGRDNQGLGIRDWGLENPGSR